MSLRKKLGRIFFCAMLETGALCGVPVSQREIESLMQMISKPNVERVCRDETGDGHDPESGFEIGSSGAEE